MSENIIEDKEGFTVPKISEEDKQAIKEASKILDDILAFEDLGDIEFDLSIDKDLIPEEMKDSPYSKEDMDSAYYKGRFLETI